MRIASIDIGTNTIRMLVASRDGRGFRAVSRLRRITALGKSLADTGAIGEEEFDRSIEALREFRTEMDRLGVIRYRACGTAGLRRSSNAGRFLSEAGKAGIRVEVISPDDFAQRVLVDALHAQVAVVGANFRYGNRAAGDVACLADFGGGNDFAVEPIPLDGGPQVWSSTYVRTCLAAGDVAGAAEALGRPYAVRGVVVKGDDRWRIDPARLASCHARRLFLRDRRPEIVAALLDVGESRAPSPSSRVPNPD